MILLTDYQQRSQSHEFLRGPTVKLACVFLFALLLLLPRARLPRADDFRLTLCHVFDDHFKSMDPTDPSKYVKGIQAPSLCS